MLIDPSSVCPQAHCPSGCSDHCLCRPELLAADLQILEQLGRIPPDDCPGYDAPSSRFPFRTIEGPNEPHPGLRSYPFLGQVTTPAAATEAYG